MEFGRLITSEIAVLYVLEYYLLFWGLNTLAYGIVSYGVWRWWRFARGLSLEQVLRVTFLITASFGTVRLIFGFVGIACLLLGVLTKIETVFVMGITSLCLNTTFILIEGITVNREANVLFSGTDETRRLRREAIQQFESLRNTLKNA